MRRFVPTLPECRVLETKIGGQIDKLYACRKQTACVTHGDTVRCRAKNDVASFQSRRVRLGKSQIYMPT